MFLNGWIKSNISGILLIKIVTRYVFRGITFSVLCTLLPTLFIGLPHFVVLLFIYYAMHIAIYIYIVLSFFLYYVHSLLFVLFVYDMYIVVDSLS